MTTELLAPYIPQFRTRARPLPSFRAERRPDMLSLKSRGHLIVPDTEDQPKVDKSEEIVLWLQT